MSRRSQGLGYADSAIDQMIAVGRCAPRLEAATKGPAVEALNDVVLLVGAGDAIGAAVARRFALSGYKVCISKHDTTKSDALIAELKVEGCEVHAFSIDARQEAKVQDLFARIEKSIGPIRSMLFNAVPMSRSRSWKPTRSCLNRGNFLSAGFLVGREAARCMTKRGRGCCSVRRRHRQRRGRQRLAAFSSAKFGLRAVAEAMARELGPKIHVARCSSLTPAWTVRRFMRG